MNGMEIFNNLPQEDRLQALTGFIGPDPRPLHFGVVGGSRIANPGVKGYLLNQRKAIDPGRDVWPSFHSNGDPRPAR
jgi:hypothetical protein